MSRLRIALAVTAAVLMALPWSATAATTSRFHPVTTASCSVSGTVVAAVGLPTNQVINFLISTSSGTTGWVLGYTWDGTWKVNVPAPSGPTTYKFVSRTWGPNGSKYTVYASCS